MNATQSCYEEREAETVLPLATFAIRFERVRNERTRFYALRIEPEAQLSLDRRESGFVLLVVRGRIGGPRPTVRRHVYRTLARAVEKWGELCARRRAHGYAEKEQEEA